LIDKYKEFIKSRRESLEKKETRSDTESMTLDALDSLSKRKISEFEKLSPEEQKNAIKYNEIGDEYYFQNDYNKAIEFYTKAIDLDSDNAIYYYNRGTGYHALKKYEKAIADYTKAIKRKPNNATFYNNRGLSYYELNEYEKAIADFSEVIKLDPNNTDYYHSLVRILCRTNDFDNAQINLNKIISLNGKSAICYNVRGFMGVKKAKHDKVKCEADVLDDLNKAIELNNNDSLAAVFYGDRAEYYLYSNEPDKAYNDLQKAVALDNMNGRIYFLMAKYYEIKGNAQEYERCMNKMKECRYTPDNSDY
jgi:tetratricopeptide (TPR) repeat protein